jgi:hypothetical protein
LWLLLCQSPTSSQLLAPQSPPSAEAPLAACAAAWLCMPHACAAAPLLLLLLLLPPVLLLQLF